MIGAGSRPSDSKYDCRNVSTELGQRTTDRTRKGGKLFEVCTGAQDETRGKTKDKDEEQRAKDKGQRIKGKGQRIKEAIR